LRPTLSGRLGGVDVIKVKITQTQNARITMKINAAVVVLLYMMRPRK